LLALEPNAPPVEIIDPSAPNGPPVPIEIAAEIGLRKVTMGFILLSLVNTCSIASGMHGQELLAANIKHVANKPYN
jgi:hypothetical protein